ncbi:MAG: LuxR C-terminal-related transcriptional regulator [Saprospiraceae bacterium]
MNENRVNLKNSKKDKVCVLGFDEPLSLLKNSFVCDAKVLVLYLKKFGKDESNFLNILNKLNKDVKIHLILKSNYSIDLSEIHVQLITDDTSYLKSILDSNGEWEIVNNSREVVTVPQEQKLIKVRLQKHALSVFHLLLEGNKYDQIATKLKISRDSVRFYVKKIYTATKVNSKSQLIAKYHGGLIVLD